MRCSYLFIYYLFWMRLCIWVSKRERKRETSEFLAIFSQVSQHWVKHSTKLKHKKCPTESFENLHSLWQWQKLQKKIFKCCHFISILMWQTRMNECSRGGGGKKLQLLYIAVVEFVHINYHFHYCILNIIFHFWFVVKAAPHHTLRQQQQHNAEAAKRHFLQDFSWFGTKHAFCSIVYALNEALHHTYLLPSAVETWFNEENAQSRKLNWDDFIGFKLWRDFITLSPLIYGLK